MRATEFITEVTIDNVKGAGATPYNQDIDYFGLRVKMKPSIFLKLALPLGQPHSAELEKYIADGGAIGSPFLEIKIPPEWDDGDFSKFAQVASHEGRNRITAVKKLEGDEPIEVHLIPRGGLRARDLTAEFVEKMQEGMYAEKSTHLVSGPLFVSGSTSIDEGKVINTYLWHGSRNKIPLLEPRQSVDTGGAEGSNQNAIYATSDPKVAIAMGLTTPGSDTGMFPNDPQMVLFSGDIRKGKYVYLHKVPFNGPDGKPQFVQGGNSREFHTIPGVKEIKPIEIKEVPVNKYLDLIRKATKEDWKLRKKYMRKQSVAENDIDEMALSTYKTFGDFTKPGPFQGPDKKLVPHPKNMEKATKFFEKTPYDFRLFFSHIPGTGKYSEHGPMTPEEIKKVFGPQADAILQDSEDQITVVFVGNKGDRKVMLTPWMMAHRFGHAIQAGNRGNRGWSAWGEAEKHFFTTINSTLGEYYGKVDRGPGSSYMGRPKSEQMNNNLTPEYNALFNAIGTQRSSRSGEIRRPYEFLYELFAQYLGTGKVTLNPLPSNLTYGRKAWGNPSKYMNIKPEFRDESERAHASEMLAGDMQMMFDDVLSSSVGKIFVM